MKKQNVDAVQANEKKSEQVDVAAADTTGALPSPAPEPSDKLDGAGQPGPETDSAAITGADRSQVSVFSDVERELIGSVVVDKLGEILSPILDAKLRELLPIVITEFGSEIAVVVREHGAGDDAQSVLSIEDVLERIKPELPELIAELVPSVRAEREQEAAKVAAADDASNARKEQVKRDRATTKAAQEAAQKRVAAQAEAGKAFDHLFGPNTAAKGFAVADVEKVALVLDDGKAFCIDFVKEIDAAQLVQVDDKVRLSAKVDLGGDMPAFVVRGVSLQVGSDLAMRCEIPTPLHIGDGRTAQLTADSLIFRAPVKPAAETD